MSVLLAELQGFADGVRSGAWLKELLSAQACGYFASLLVFLTFWMQRMVPLRTIAICSNIAFFTYALLLGLPPIAILHAGLLPINIWRLWQLRKLARPPGHARPALGMRLQTKYLVEAAAVVALSLTFIGGAVSQVADSAIHCRIEHWRDWTPACRQVAQHALAATALAHAPVAMVARVAPERSLSDTDLHKLVRAARSNPRGRRDALMILLAYRQRLTPTALLRLRWRDLGLAHGTLFRRVSAHPHYALAPDEIREFERLRHETVRRSPYVFASSDGRPLSFRRFARIVDRARIEAGLPVRPGPTSPWQVSRGRILP